MILTIRGLPDEAMLLIADVDFELDSDKAIYFIGKVKELPKDIDITKEYVFFRTRIADGMFDPIDKNFVKIVNGEIMWQEESLMKIEEEK